MYSARTHWIALAIVLAGTAFAQDEATLTLDFSPGYTHALKTVRLSVTEFEDGHLAMEETLALDLRVDKIADDGAAEIVGTVTDAGLRVDARWIDGESEEVQGVIRAASDVMKGKLVRFRLTPDGELSDLQGDKELRQAIDKAAENAKANPTPETEALVSLLEVWLKPPTLAYELAAAFHGLRKEPIALGESWTVDDKANAYVKSDLKRTFTFESISAKQVEIRVKGGGTASAEHGITIKEALEGTIHLNRATHWPDSAEITINIDQNYLVDGQPHPAKSTVTTTLTGSSANPS